MQALINDQEIDFKLKNDKVFATSLDVARVFGKNHKDVLRIIDGLPRDEFHKRNFAPSTKARKNGIFMKDTKLYNLTRDGFTILVMGFTGEQAYKFKIAFINAFNQMEKMIQEQLVLKKYGIKPFAALPSGYDLPSTPFRQILVDHIGDIENKYGVKVSGIQEYTITEKYQNGDIIRTKEVSVMVADEGRKAPKKRKSITGAKK